MKFTKDKKQIILKFTKEEKKLILQFIEDVQKVIYEIDGEEEDRDELFKDILRYKMHRGGREIKEIDSFTQGYLVGMFGEEVLNVIEELGIMM